MTRLYAAFVASVIALARHVPAEWGSVVDEFAQDLVGYSRFMPPMPGRQLVPGRAFMGQAVCENPDCRERQVVFFPAGAEREIELVCPVCGEETMGVA